MKPLVLLCAFAVMAISTWAQADPAAATLKNIQHVPTFKIFTAPDSTEYTSESIKQNKPFVLMFFSPDCDHCQKEAKELLAYREELKHLPILMVSPAPFKEIKTFYQDYNIASMTNITMGQDLNYALGLKYQPRIYPSIFVYDSRGILAKVFAGNIGVPAILDAVK